MRLLARPTASVERGAALRAETLRISRLAARVWRRAGRIAAGREHLRLGRSIQVQNGWSGVRNSGCETQPLQSLTPRRGQISLHRFTFLFRSFQRLLQLDLGSHAP